MAFRSPSALHFFKNNILQGNFIDSNCEANSVLLCDLVKKISESFNQVKCTEFKKEKTYSATLRKDLQLLITKLKQTVNGIYVLILYIQKKYSLFSILFKIKINKTSTHFFLSQTKIQIQSFSPILKT